MTSIAAVGAEPEILFQQKDELLKVCNGVTEEVADTVIRVELKPSRVAALRISGEVKTTGVTGPTGDSLLIITNVYFEKSPVFWDTVLFPDTGTHPWQHVECYVRPREPITSFELHFRLTKTIGKASFRNFRVETVEPWDENADLSVTILGDSTDMVSYIEEPYRIRRRLELLLRDRFPAKNISVYNIAESGDYLKQLLSKGRLERELATLPRCDIMIIRYGLNDLGNKTTPEEFKTLLSDACDRILKRFPTTRIMISTTIPPHAGVLDNSARVVARERGYPLVELAEFLEQEAKQGNGNWHTGPGRKVGFRTTANPADDPTGLKGNKHPNIYGSKLIAEKLYQTIEPVSCEILRQKTGR